MLENVYLVYTYKKGRLIKPYDDWLREDYTNVVDSKLISYIHTISITGTDV